MIVPTQHMYDIPDSSTCKPIDWECCLKCSTVTRDHTHNNYISNLSTACRHIDNNTDMHIIHITNWKCEVRFHWDRQAFGYIPTIHYVFKFQWIHGIVQFTMCITSRCILHRVPNQHINRYIICSMHFVIMQSTRAEHVSGASCSQTGGCGHIESFPGSMKKRPPTEAAC